MRRPVSPRLTVRAALAVAVAIGLAAPLVAQTARVPRVIGSLENGDNALIVLPSGRVRVFADSNKFGQLGLGTMEECTYGQPCAKDTILPGVTDAVDGAAGADCFFVLRSDGTILAWGSNGSGRLGLSPPGTVPEFGKLPKPVPTPTQIPGLSGVRQIAAGGSFGVALLDDGTLRTWGGNHTGQLGLGSAFPSALKQALYSPYPQPIPGLSGVTAIAAAGAGNAHALALMKDGTVRAWGSNHHGLLGVEGIRQSDVPVPVPGIERAVAVATSIDYSLALIDDGTVRVWGSGTLHGAYFGGATGSSIHTEDAAPWSAQPLAIPGLRSVTAIAAGANALALLADGTVRTWGYNGYFSMGLGHNVQYPKGLQTPKLSGVAAVAGAWNNSFFVLQDGTVLRAGLPYRVLTVILTKEDAAKLEAVQ